MPMSRPQVLALFAENGYEPILKPRGDFRMCGECAFYGPENGCGGKPIIEPLRRLCKIDNPCAGLISYFSPQPNAQFAGWQAAVSYKYPED
jgi:hypothetical protein